MTKTFLHTNTESGTIALFEPGQVTFEECFEDEPYNVMVYMREGKLLVLGIGGDGGVKISLEMVETLSKPTGEHIEGRIEVSGNRLYFGGGETLPRDSDGFEERPGAGEWAEVPTGKYHYVFESVNPENPPHISFELKLKRVDSFDGVPFPQSGVQYLEG